MKNNLQKISMVIFSTCMLFMLLATMTLTAFADEENQNHEVQKISGQVTASTISDNAVCSIAGDTTLILDCTKTIEKIYADEGNLSSLTIKGNGTLNISTICLSGGCINIESGNVNVKCDESELQSRKTGIYNTYTPEPYIDEEGTHFPAQMGNITISGGNVTVENFNDYGIYGTYIDVTGGSITLRNCRSGIYANQKLNVAGGTFTCDNMQEYCIYSETAFNITGGTVTCNHSCIGMYSANEANISGGKVAISECFYSGIEARYIMISNGQVDITFSGTSDEELLVMGICSADMFSSEKYMGISGGKTNIKGCDIGIYSDSLAVTGGSLVIDAARAAILSQKVINIDSQIAKNENLQIKTLTKEESYQLLNGEELPKGQIYFTLKTINDGGNAAKTVAVGVGKIVKEGWKKDSTGWWYQNADGTYPKNRWKKIAGKWYHFDAKGYMQTGWYKEGEIYYYLKADGSMAADEWVDNEKYYVDANGKWVKDKVKITAGWKKDSIGWWYQNADGTYPKNQWKKIADKWYHFDAKGYMQTGWYKEGNVYYYLKSDGSMAADEWVDNGKYYVDSKGHWVK